MKLKDAMLKACNKYGYSHQELGINFDKRAKLRRKNESPRQSLENRNGQPGNA